MGMAGMRKTAAQIADLLKKRFGTGYRADGRRVVRDTPQGEVLIIEARR